MIKNLIISALLCTQSKLIIQGCLNTEIRRKQKRTPHAKAGSDSLWTFTIKLKGVTVTLQTLTFLQTCVCSWRHMCAYVMHTMTT